MSVLRYENMTLKITCTFAEGTSSEGCQVTLIIDEVTSFNITIHRSVLYTTSDNEYNSSLYTLVPVRSGDDLEVVHYNDSTTGVPSMVQAEDVGVSDPLIISGSITTVVVPPTPSCECSVHFLYVGHVTVCV